MGTNLADTEPEPDVQLLPEQLGAGFARTASAVHPSGHLKSHVVPTSRTLEQFINELRADEASVAEVGISLPPSGNQGIRGRARVFPVR